LALALDSVEGHLVFPEEDVGELRGFGPDDGAERSDEVTVVGDLNVNVDSFRPAFALERLEGDHVELTGLK
jgi:hypothetical protein